MTLRLCISCMLACGPVPAWVRVYAAPPPSHFFRPLFKSEALEVALEDAWPAGAMCNLHWIRARGTSAGERVHVLWLGACAHWRQVGARVCYSAIAVSAAALHVMMFILCCIVDERPRHRLALSWQQSCNMQWRL